MNRLFSLLTLALALAAPALAQQRVLRIHLADGSEQTVSCADIERISYGTDAGEQVQLLHTASGTSVLPVARIARMELDTQEAPAAPDGVDARRVFTKGLVSWADGYYLDYDEQGRLVKMVSEDEDYQGQPYETYDIRYEPGRMLVSGTDGSGQWSCTYEYVLGADGLAHSYTMTETDEWESQTETATFSYNAEGRLTHIQAHCPEVQGHTEFNFDWQDGNLVGFTTSEETSEVSSASRCSLLYGTQPNVGNGVLLLDMDIFTLPYYAGVMGVGPVSLPVSQHEVDYDDGELESDQTDTLEWRTDALGRALGFTATNSSGEQEDYNELLRWW